MIAYLKPSELKSGDVISIIEFEHAARSGMSFYSRFWAECHLTASLLDPSKIEPIYVTLLDSASVAGLDLDHSVGSGTFIRSAELGKIKVFVPSLSYIRVLKLGPRSWFVGFWLIFLSFLRARLNKMHIGS